MSEGSENSGLNPEEYFEHTMQQWDSARRSIAEEFQTTGQVSPELMFRYVSTNLLRDNAAMRAFPEVYDTERAQEIFKANQAVLRDCQMQTMSDGIVTILTREVTSVRDRLGLSEHLPTDSSERPAVVDAAVDTSANRSGLINELSALNYCLQQYKSGGGSAAV